MEFRRLKKVDVASAKFLAIWENFDIILQAALNLAGFQGPRKIKKNIDNFKFWKSCKNLVEYVRTVALRESDEVTIHKIRNFIELYDSKLRVFLARAKLISQKRRSKAPEELPLEEDVRLF